MRKALLVLSILTSTLAYARQPTHDNLSAQFDTHSDETDVPSQAYQDVTSDEGPMSEEEVLRAYEEEKAAEQGLWIFDKVSKVFDKPYTYVRCHYRQDPSPRNPQTVYTWAKDANGKDYKLYGAWVYGKSKLPNNAMFFTDISHHRLEDICRNTLKSKGLPGDRQVELIAAGNNALSYDSQIWSQDIENQPHKMNRFVVFGDSLSDDHNMFNNSNWLLPNRQTWSGGRFANGRVWSEVVADAFDLPMNNWAMGGAATTTYKSLVQGLSQQVDSFAGYIKSAKNYQPQNTLFAVWIGANDLNNGFTVDKMMRYLRSSMEHLVSLGARDILLLNLPDISRAPSFKIKKGRERLDMSNKVKEYNRQMAKMVDELRQKYRSRGLEIHFFDAYKLFDQLLDSPAQYGMTNVSQSCLDLPSGAPTLYLKTQKLRSECYNPKLFAFWDLQHPTEQTHWLLAENIIDFLVGGGLSRPKPDYQF